MSQRNNYRNVGHADRLKAIGGNLRQRGIPASALLLVLILLLLITSGGAG